MDNLSRKREGFEPKPDDDIELPKPVDHDVKEMDIGDPVGYEVDGGEIPSGTFDLPQFEDVGASIERIETAETSVIGKASTIDRQDAINYGLEDEYKVGYLPAKKNVAVFESNQMITKKYLVALSNRQEKMSELKQRGILDINQKQAEAAIEMAKQSLLTHAEEMARYEKHVGKFEKEFRKREIVFLTPLPALETRSEQSGRIAEAEMKATSKGAITRSTAKEFGLEEEHQKGYMPARTEVSVLSSDVAFLLKYKKELRERSLLLKNKSIEDPYKDNIRDAQELIDTELRDKTKVLKELKLKLKHFEEEVRKESYRQETDMPATTTPEAMRDAAKDIVVLTGQAGVGTVMKGIDVTKWAGRKTASATGKVARGAGAATRAGGGAVGAGGMIGMGIFFSSLVEGFKAVMEIFTGKKRKE